jgi:hypothetical protein
MRCCCCGPVAAQASRINKYWRSINLFPDQYHDLALADHGHPMVLCGNFKCNRQPQSFKCAMLFMERLIAKVPHCAVVEHPWVLAMRPYYERHKQGAPPPNDHVEVPCCICCSLSVTIPDGMRTTLRPMVAPLPIPGDKATTPATVAEGIASSNLNEHTIKNIMRESDGYNNDANDEEDVPVPVAVAVASAGPPVPRSAVGAGGDDRAFLGWGGRPPPVLLPRRAQRDIRGESRFKAEPVHGDRQEFRGLPHAEMVAHDRPLKQPELICHHERECSLSPSVRFPPAI